MNNNIIKVKVNRIIKARNLCSLMNNTKWNELIIAMKTQMPFEPPFDIKYLTETEHPYDTLNQNNVFYLGDWNGEYFPTQDFYCNIEWIKIRPQYLKHQGRLIPPITIDATKKFEEILAKYQIPYEVENGLYTIYGYR